MRQLTIELQGKIEVNSFIEIGSRDGHDTHHLCSYWNISPNRCYIIEAHPECYQYIINTYPQYNVFNIAASDRNGVISFNAGVIGVESNIGISSILNRSDGVDFISKQINVDAWKMMDVMTQLKIDSFDLGKIDVEGATLQVLEGFGNKLQHFKALQLELEKKEVWKGQALYDDVVVFMKSNGFYIFDDIDLDGNQRDVLFIR